MGLGKTLQALSIAYYYKAEWPLLIVVPSSLRYTWVEEIEKWFPEILPEQIKMIESGMDIGEIASSKVCVVSYGLIRHSGSKLLQEALCNQNFKIIIVDESHNIKNWKAASTRYLVPLIRNCQRRLLLTGTPSLAAPQELFSQLDALCPGVFGSWSSYSKRYCDAGFKFYGRRRQWVTDGASNLEELQGRLTELVMIRRLKKDVLTQLPPKQRQKIVFELKNSDVKKELDEIWNQLQVALGKKNMTLTEALGQEKTAEPIDSPPPLNNNVDSDAATDSFTVYRLISELYRKSCMTKLGPVKEYIKMLCENKELKFIVFAHHHAMLNCISEQLIDENVKFVRIDGSTASQDRPRLVAQFQSDVSTRVAVLSIKAAGVGLTFTAASLVVFAELYWTPGVMEQCEDRAHRIGQRNSVNVHYLVAKGTLDERVWSALARKTTVITTMLNGEKQVLTMDPGFEHQVNCLSNADACAPADNADVNVTMLLSSQLGNQSQKSVLDFFTPNSKKEKSTDCLR